ncbi:MAG: cupin domain-containing protein [Thermaerobacterales bacterium]
MAEPRIHHFDPNRFRWDGVDERDYKFHQGAEAGWGWRDVTRHVLTGRDDPAAFEMRYFEIGPDGHSTLEKHRHTHAVTIARGQGKVLLGDRVIGARPYDFIYVPPHVPHQFVNCGPQPFGFFCVVDRERDRPQALSPDELTRLTAVRETAAVMRL